MAAILIGNWWALALRGAVAIIFAIVAFVSPVATGAALVVEPRFSASGFAASLSESR